MPPITTHFFLKPERVTFPSISAQEDIERCCMGRCCLPLKRNSFLKYIRICGGHCWSWLLIAHSLSQLLPASITPLSPQNFFFFSISNMNTSLSLEFCFQETQPKRISTSMCIFYPPTIIFSHVFRDYSQSKLGLLGIKLYI